MENIDGLPKKSFYFVNDRNFQTFLLEKKNKKKYICIKIWECFYFDVIFCVYQNRVANWLAGMVEECRAGNFLRDDFFFSFARK